MTQHLYTDILSILPFPATHRPRKQWCDGVLTVKETNSRCPAVQWHFNKRNLNFAATGNRQGITEMHVICSCTWDYSLRIVRNLLDNVAVYAHSDPLAFRPTSVRALIREHDLERRASRSLVVVLFCNRMRPSSGQSSELHFKLGRRLVSNPV